MNRNFYEDFSRPNELNHILQHIRENGFWGGDMEINAFVHAMQTTIILYRINEPPRMYKAENEERVIQIAHLCETHYDILIDPNVDYSGTVITVGSTTHVSEQKGNTSQAPSVKEIVQRSISTLNDGEEMKNTEETLTKLLQTVLLTKESAIEWFQEIGLFYKTRFCNRCNKEMKRRTNIRRQYGDFYCQTCHQRKTIKKDNLLSSLRSPPHSIAQAFIRWLKGEKREDIAHETNLSVRTISRFSEILLAACIVLLQRNSNKIGGQNRVVEIDECLLHRRKYNVGRLKESGWVLGGVERPQEKDVKPRIFLISIPDRSRESIEKAIQEWVEPGTIIITDCLRSYDHLEELGYHHFNVNHSENFVDPVTSAHTERIEGLWHWIRSNAIPRSGCQLHEIDFYLAAYLYRRTINDNISQFFKDLCEVSLAQINQILKSKKELANQYRQHNTEPPESDSSSHAIVPRSQSITISDSDSDAETPTDPLRLVQQTFVTSPRRKHRYLQHSADTEKHFGFRAVKMEEISVIRQLDEKKKIIDSRDQDSVVFDYIQHMQYVRAVRMRYKPKKKRSKVSHNSEHSQTAIDVEVKQAESPDQSITIETSEEENNHRAHKRPDRFSPPL